MRKFIFKGRDAASNEWREGQLFQQKMSDGIHTLISPSLENKCWYEVFPDTVCEWTGVRDSNGTRIFENDLVGLNGEMGFVTWDKLAAQFLVAFPNFATTFNELSGEDLTIIGNICEGEEEK